MNNFKVTVEEDGMVRCFVEEGTQIRLVSVTPLREVKDCFDIRTLFNKYISDITAGISD